jgi:hypothetical protein
LDQTVGVGGVFGGAQFAQKMRAEKQPGQARENGEVSGLVATSDEKE